MFYTIIIFLVLIASVIALGVLFFKKIPELRTLDISTIPQEKQDNAKIKILEAKFLRQKVEAQKKMSQTFAPLKSRASSLIRAANENLNSLEKKYKKREELDETKNKSINELFAEAQAFMSSGNYPRAEKFLIEIIFRDKKNIIAYEKLSELYRLNKSYNQAEEVLRYLIKLKTVQFKKNKGVENTKKDRPDETESEMLQTLDLDKDLSGYYDDLAKVYELTDKKEKSLDYYLKANVVEPNNPKFLDKVINLSICVGDVGLAKKTYRRLKEINPENAKLAEFSEALEKMK